MRYEINTFEMFDMSGAVSRFRTIIILSFYHIFIFTCFVATAQTTITATLKADSNNITIGDHLNVRLSVKHPKYLKLLMPQVKDSIGNMDFISASKMDTVEDATSRTFIQTYTVSAYDSGMFHAGPLEMFFKNTAGQVDTVYSNDVPISVNTVAIDTAKPFKPIKAPLEIPYSWREFIPYIVGGSILLLLAIVGFILWRKYRPHKPIVVARPQPKDPAHIWARKELKKLEEEKLWQKGEIKQYYSRLSDILRMYLEYRFGWFALESTTEEIQIDMSNYNMKEKAKENLLQILRIADLVKFAKMHQMPEENMRAMESAYRFIDFTEPKEQEEKNKN